MSYDAAVAHQAIRRRRLRYHLEVWVEGIGKALSAEFEQDDLRVISIKSGDWPSRLFGLQD